MRSLWKDALSFGLVSIPVKLYAATRSHDVRFHLLHRPCRTPICYQRFCPACERAVAPEEIARGYEHAVGYVLVEDADFEALPLPTRKTIEILDFVRLDEIDPVYFEPTYFLEPADGGGKAYALLRRVMRETGRVAVAKVALRAKESLACVRVYGREGEGLLALATMFYPDEVRSHAELEAALRPAEVSDRELAVARQLVESLSVSFDAARYRDEYREALLKVIAEKVRGQEVVAPPEPAPTRVVDLVAALEESIRHGGLPRAGRSGRPGAPGARLGGYPILDGEVMVLHGGRPSFPRVVRREEAAGPGEATRLAAALPASFAAFDLLDCDGEDLTGRPWWVRQELLARVAEEDGRALLAALAERGLEGVAAKERSSP